MYLKERLAAGECLIGAGIYSNSPEVMEYAARGMDWIWWEAQHTHADWQATIHGVRTAYGMRIPTLIRTWTHNGDTIERLLDTGAEGIIVPMVNTPQQAEEIVKRCYYPPIGNRSFGAVRMQTIEEETNEWNKRIVTVMTLETPSAIENAEMIANISGVDALLVGAADLSLRLGKVPNVFTSHSNISDELAHVLAVCRSTGKAAAVIASTPEALSARISEGFRLICAGMDVDHLKADYERMRDAFKMALRNITTP